MIIFQHNLFCTGFTNNTRFFINFFYFFSGAQNARLNKMFGSSQRIILLIIFDVGVSFQETQTAQPSNYFNVLHQEKML